MKIIHKQIVMDEAGRPVSVLIPYQEWLNIEQQLKALPDADQAQRLQQFGNSINLRRDPLEYQHDCRDEWG